MKARVSLSLWALLRTVTSGQPGYVSQLEILPGWKVTYDTDSCVTSNSGSSELYFALWHKWGRMRQSPSQLWGYLIYNVIMHWKAISSYFKRNNCKYSCFLQSSLDRLSDLEITFSGLKRAPVDGAMLTDCTERMSLWTGTFHRYCENCLSPLVNVPSLHWRFPCGLHHHHTEEVGLLWQEWWENIWFY